jgi:hypothetical protein
MSTIGSNNGFVHASKNHGEGVVRFPLEAAMVGTAAEPEILYQLWVQRFGIENARRLHLTAYVTLEDFGTSLFSLREAFSAGAGWIIDSPGVLTVILLPRFVCDTRYRLHSEEGPAACWQNGSVDYRLQGISVNPDVVLDPDSVGAEEILAETNLERRRVMIERIGLGRLIESVRAKRVDADLDHGSERQLWTIPASDEEPVAVLKIVCPSTGRTYFLRVPPEMRSCEEAVAWSFNRPVEGYAPITET